VFRALGFADLKRLSIDMSPALSHTLYTAGQTNLLELHQRPALLVILILTYAGIAFGHVPGLKLDRSGIALLGAIAAVSVGGVSIPDSILYINWPTILLLFGFFVISAQLQLSGFYHKIADHISVHLEHPAFFLFILMMVAGGLSAILNHDVVCLVFTPIVGAAVLGKRLNPCPYLIALAISSNLGASATLIGSPQNMMIGELAHLDFGRYVLWCAAPVGFAFVSAYAIIWMLSRKTIRQNAIELNSLPKFEPAFDRQHTLKGIVILIVVIALFFTSLPKEVIVLTAAGVHLASPKYHTADLLGLVEWPVLVLFMGLFVVTGAFSSGGYEAALRTVADAGFDLKSPSQLALTTVVLSNLINNAAAVMLLLKVVPVSDPTAGYVLALANSFAGNLIIIGSVSNLIVIQQARRFGIDISFNQFARLGIPVTIVTIAGLVGWVTLIS